MTPDSFMCLTSVQVCDDRSPVCFLLQSESCECYTTEILHNTENVIFVKVKFWVDRLYIDGLVQERCNSSALAMELRLSCINPLICKWVEIFFIVL